MPEKPKLLLLDANVLIDYKNSDFTVLGLVNKHVEDITVLTTILEEAKGIEHSDCEELGLRIEEPALSQLSQASFKKGPLSFHDHLCLIFASDKGLICVTNDKALRQACKDEGVDLHWGLELMTELVRGQAMLAADAIEVAEKIHLRNPLHIPETLVERFSEIVLGM